MENVTWMVLVGAARAARAAFKASKLIMLDGIDPEHRLRHVVDTTRLNVARSLGEIALIMAGPTRHPTDRGSLSGDLRAAFFGTLALEADAYYERNRPRSYLEAMHEEFGVERSDLSNWRAIDRTADRTPRGIFDARDFGSLS